MINEIETPAPLFSEYRKAVGRNALSLNRYYNGEGFSIHYTNRKASLTAIDFSTATLKLLIVFTYKPYYRSERLKHVLVPSRFIFLKDGQQLECISPAEQNEHFLIITMQKGFIGVLFSEFEGLAGIITGYDNSFRNCSRRISVLSKQFLEYAVSGRTGPVRIKHWILEILIEAISLLPANDPLPNAWLNYIDLETLLNARTYLQEGERITIEAMCKKFGLNPRKLKAGFNFLFGHRVYEYYRLYQLNQAKIELQTTNKSIKEIAYGAGYNQASGFAQGFRRQFGYTPSEYREMRTK